MDVTFHSMSAVTFRRMEDRPSYLAGARAGLAFALPTLVVGISFGALARSLGWGEVAPVVASVLVFSASAQFGIASVLAAGGGHVAALLAAALVNARFLPMGIAVAGSLRGGTSGAPSRGRRWWMPRGRSRAGVTAASTAAC